MIASNFLHPSSLFNSLKGFQHKTLLFQTIYTKSYIKGRFNFNSGSSNNSKSWIKYAVGIPFVSGLVLYQYTKYKFLKYTVPEENGT
jgi:hypothetical protein